MAQLVSLSALNGDILALLERRFDTGARGMRLVAVASPSLLNASLAP